MKKLQMNSSLKLSHFQKIIYTCLLSLLPGLLLAQDMSGDLRVGSSAVVITPPLGVPMAGQYFERRAEGVHNDLYAKSIVIEKNEVRVAIISCDLVELSPQLVGEIRELVGESTGIHGSHVMVGATHSHTGPVVSQEDMYSSKGETARIHARYLKELPELIASSVERAVDQLQPATISAGAGHEEKVSFNRRFYMQDGTVGWNPGVLNPGIIKPAGPIDPGVQVLYAESEDGTPITTYVNFALHLDIVGGLEISADFPYTMGTTLAGFKGKEMVTMFGQGCCGNVNHVNVKKPGPQAGHQLAADIGSVVGAEVIKTYSRMEHLKVDQIQAHQEVVGLSLAPIDPETVPAARELTAKFGAWDVAPFMDMVEAFKVVDVYERNGTPIDFEIQAFALGDQYAIVALPGEIFTELGMYIKERSPFPHTMVIELANGNIGYVPDMKAFIEGNYEPVSARCAPGSGELMVEKTLEILHQLKTAL